MAAPPVFVVLASCEHRTEVLGLQPDCWLLGRQPLAGNFNNSTPTNQGSNGNYWSSTRNDNTNMYNLNFNTSSVNPANNNNRNNGNSVRCVLQ